MDNAAIAAVFLARIEADRERRETGTVEDSQHLVPGFEAVVAREFRTLVEDAEPGPSIEFTGADAPGLDRPVPAARLGRFRMLRPIVHGGQGEVYLAEGDYLRRRVALKVLPGLGPYTEDRPAARDPALHGITIHLQALAYHPVLPPTGIHLSNGARTVPGTRGETAPEPAPCSWHRTRKLS